MAITVTSLQPKGAGWIKNATSTDLSGTEEIIAAPAAGVSHYIRSVVINAGSAITVTLGAGETGGAVTAVVLGPISMAANSTTGQMAFHPPLEVGAATALVVDASGAGNVCIIVQGSTE